MNQDLYSTHQQLLTSAALATTGSLLEIGGGLYSTPILSSIAHFTNRNAYTMETNDWVYRRLKRFAHAKHEIILMQGFPFIEGKFMRGDTPPRVFWEIQETLLQDMLDRHGRFGLVFIDQRPGFLRHMAAKFFAQHADFVLIHDSQQADRYRLSLAFAEFKYRYDFTGARPNTTALSNFFDCERIFDFLPKGRPYKVVPMTEAAKAIRDERWGESYEPARMDAPE